MNTNTSTTQGRPFRITIRFSPDEYQLLKRRQKESASQTLSDYLRGIVLRGKVVIRHRNDSLDRYINELSLMRGALGAVGNNFNQVVRRLNQFQSPQTLVLWRESAERLQQDLLAKTEAIHQQIDKTYELWSQG